MKQLYTQKPEIPLETSQEPPQAALFIKRVSSLHLRTLTTPLDYHLSLIRRFSRSKKLKNLPQSIKTEQIQELVSSYSYSLIDYLDRNELLESLPLAKELIKQGFPSNSLLSLLRCGSEIGDSVSVACECGVRRYKIKHHCSSRSCPYCSKRRQRLISRKYLPIFSNFPTTPRDSLKFLTVSPPNYNSLEEGEKHLRESLAKFWRRKYSKERVYGGFYVIESKEKNGLWNVHAHIIYYGRRLENRVKGYCKSCKKKVFLKKDSETGKMYCNQKKCNRLTEWDGEDSDLNKELFDSFGMKVHSHIKLIKDRTGTGYFKDKEHLLNYMLKYVSVNKDDFSSIKSFARYICHTRNRKLINKFGVFRKLSYTQRPSMCNKCKTPHKITYECGIIISEEQSSVPPPIEYKKLP